MEVESQVPEQPEEEAVNPFSKMSAEVRRPVEGVIHLGSLTDSFEFAAHHFQIRTLKANEELAAAAAIKEFRGTLKEAEAYITAQIGLALVAIDGDDAFCPALGPDLEAHAAKRFKYVNEYHWPVIEYLFTKYAELKNEADAAIDEIANLSGRSLLISSPSVDSLIAPATFSSGIDGEIAVSPPFS